MIICNCQKPKLLRRNKSLERVRKKLLEQVIFVINLFLLIIMFVLICILQRPDLYILMFLISREVTV